MVVFSIVCCIVCGVFFYLLKFVRGWGKSYGLFFRGDKCFYLAVILISDSLIVKVEFRNVEI